MFKLTNIINKFRNAVFVKSNKKKDIPVSKSVENSELNKHKRITHGGGKVKNSGSHTPYNGRKTLQKSWFGTFSPIGKF